MRNDASSPRRAPLFALLALAASCSVPRTAPSPAASPSPAGSVRVLVYNIHAGKDAAGTPRIAELAGLVGQTGADIVLLQEVDVGTRRSGGVDQPAELARRTGFASAFGRTIDYDGGRFGIAVLSRWPILDARMIPLDGPPPAGADNGRHEPRGALRVVVGAPQGRITVFDTHLDAFGGDAWREQEADSLVKLVASARENGEVVILGGDFNSTPESAAQQTLRNAGLRDAWSLCGSGNGHTFPANDPKKRIDFLFLTGSTSCTSARVPDSQLSDHRPLLVDVALPSSIAAFPTNLDPRTPLTALQQRWVDSTLASLSLRERVGQMVNVWVLGDYTNYQDSSFAEVLRWIRDDHVGGVSMSLGSPIEVAAKVNTMQRAAKVPLMVAADLEPNLGRLDGGVFDHYLMDAGGATIFPNAMAIGATGRVEDAYLVGRAMAEEGKASGILVNFAPVVDVNNNPANPVINTRSFGEDPKRVAELSAAFVKGTQDAGAMATIKHFPGHGDTDVDSHVGLPMVNATMARLDTVELVPFHAGIEAGAGLVMTAHIALPAVQGDSTTPATLAPRIITALLRDSLDFGGLAITDAMTMGGIGKGYTTEESSVLAVKAGADVLLKPENPTAAVNAVLAAVERGEISRARIDSSVRRVLEIKARTGVAFQPTVSLEHLRQVVHSPAHVALAADIARRSVTLLRDRDDLVPVGRDSAGGRTVLVQYMPPSELRAGSVFTSRIRSAVRGTRVFQVSPATDSATLASIAAAARGADRVIVATYVRRIEGEGRFAIPAPIAAFIDSLGAHERTVVVSFGNPYLIRQFPSVGSYLVTYGVAEVLEDAAAGALLGRAPITGRIPVSLPRFFARGDGLQRAATAAAP
jgi:beta-N-acetylhexosaminidase